MRMNPVFSLFRSSKMGLERFRDAGNDALIAAIDSYEGSCVPPVDDTKQIECPIPRLPSGGDTSLVRKVLPL